MEGGPHTEHRSACPHPILVHVTLSYSLALALLMSPTLPGARPSAADRSDRVSWTRHNRQDTTPSGAEAISTLVPTLYGAPAYRLAQTTRDMDG